MKQLESDDPMALVGVRLDEDPGDEALEEMAWCFVEEYARMGLDGEHILRLFRSPFFRGPHRVLHVKGEDFVRGIIAAVDGIRQQLSTLEARR